MNGQDVHSKSQRQDAALALVAENADKTAGRTLRNARFRSRSRSWQRILLAFLFLFLYLFQRIPMVLFFIFHCKTQGFYCIFILIWQLEYQNSFLLFLWSKHIMERIQIIHQHCQL